MTGAVGPASGQPLRWGRMEILGDVLQREPDGKLLIVSCDDFGTSHASNAGVLSAIRNGWATSASLMVPAPWAREAAAHHRGEDVGVHLTLNAEYELFRWGPLTRAPSLLGGDGGFPRTVSDLWDHADLDEVRFECRAQIERAIYWGFDVTHLDSHLGSLILRPEFFDVLVDLAMEFSLPLRLPTASAEETMGFPFRRLASDEGILFPDRVVFLPGATRSSVTQAIHNLTPGVTEFVFCPAVDTPELRAISDDWQTYVTQLDLLESNDYFMPLLEQTGVKLIGYAALREAQRQELGESV